MNKKESKPKKAPKLPKKKYKLIKDVQTQEKLYKKGEDIELTENGRKHFKFLNRI